ncbi:monovalent cation/H(+) antiporter subunit G [Caenispirillum bisanense]|uniref:Multisubunit sodium/proton antiporter, MrpG subunit n=1 Tax=Caenispirillum bisanense TaxID=414052 RepID=A0A286G2K7_9PROT|nr:monovalent cation/H(+) antiporter subunit G [Caenispirillum bisanense]SOD89224.1 multisubunit sodium/proton antiporter, MrpG subunit [Caenispirillum bisanense]
MIADLIVAALLLAGGFFALVAALGVVRLPDVFIRMHASTKAGTLGGGLILAAVAVSQWEAGVTTRVVLIIAFLLVTAPIAAHLIGRAAYRIGVPLWHNTVVDEWQHDRPAAPEEPPARAPAAPPYGPHT